MSFMSQKSHLTVHKSIATPRTLPRLVLLTAAIFSLMITGCDNKSTDDDTAPAAEKDKVARLIPLRIKERKSWATDILAIFDEEKIPHTVQNLCSVVAIVDQESNFKADPAVPNLPNDAKKALFERIQDKLGDTGVDKFKEMLQSKPTPTDNFMSQIDKIKTEQDLDVLYQKMFDYFRDHYNLSIITGAASLFAGHDMKEYFNPIKTLGSMQVHVNFAFAHPRKSSKTTDIRQEMYTQYGGMYYGINRLMGYKADYNKPIYRFADYNSGVYSSRNAAFQTTIGKLSEIPLDLDGDLLAYNKDQEALPARSDVEMQLSRLVRENQLGLSDSNIRSDLLKEKNQDFEDTETYKKVNALYLAKFKKAPPYAAMPHVQISGPKLSRDYDTNWYASRVDGRYRRCESMGKRLHLTMGPVSNADDSDDDSDDQ
jgi:hypothetical protein